MAPVLSNAQSKPLNSISVVTALALFLSGCTTIAKDGPYAGEIEKNATVVVKSTPEKSRDMAYVAIALTPDIIHAVNSYTLDSLPAFPKSVRGGGAASIRIATGDKVSITIFEAAAGGLFISDEGGSRPGNFVQIPAQQVDSRGMINVPYAGLIRAAGRNESDVANEIVTKLANRAIEPQVVVAIDERRSSEIAVLGEVNNPVRFSLEPGGTKILSALARAGGNRYPSYETIITLQRNKQTYKASLATITGDPKENIELSEGDMIYLSHSPRVFLAFGATPSPGASGGQSSRRFAFDEENVSFAAAVAKAGGLDSDRANPSAVFLYRYENRETLQNLGVDVSKFSGEQVPTVFTVDMRRADALFLTQSLMVRNDDIIYVADAPAYDLAKVMSTIRSVNSPIGEVRSTVRSF